MRRHLETKNQGRQCHLINGSAYYMVTYSQGGSSRANNDLETSVAAFCCWDKFIVNLAYGSICLEMGRTFLSQDL